MTFFHSFFRAVSSLSLYTIIDSSALGLDEVRFDWGGDDGMNDRATSLQRGILGMWANANVRVKFVTANKHTHTHTLYISVMTNIRVSLFE